MTPLSAHILSHERRLNNNIRGSLSLQIERRKERRRWLLGCIICIFLGCIMGRFSISQSLHNQKNEKETSINVGLLQNEANSTVINEQVSPAGHNKTTTSKLELQKKVHPIIISANNVSEVYDMTFWGSKRLCKSLLNNMKEEERHLGNNGSISSPILVNMTFNCNDMSKGIGLPPKTAPVGTGNWIWLFYTMRLASLSHGNVNFNAVCEDDSLELRKHQILPWIVGHFNHSNAKEEIVPSKSALESACNSQQKVSLSNVIPPIRRDLGYMAKSLVGIPKWHHQMKNNNTSKNTTPEYPNVELDEIVWHFRCGDLMYSTHPGYAWHKFGLLSSYINNNTQSIGIVTEPFRKHRIKAKNEAEEDTLESSAKACERLAGALVDYLQERFPEARIRLRNDVNESVALSYSRLIVAKQTIVGSVSTFGAYAALASRGESFIIKPDFDHAPNAWMVKGMNKATNLTMVHDPSPLLVTQSTYLWWSERKTGGREAMIDWLKDKGEAESSLIRKARAEYPSKEMTINSRLK